MTDPALHQRRSIRLQGFDYSQPGAYFVTIVTQGRECMFGEVMDGKMRLNDAGRMVERWWGELGNRFPRVMPDAHVVMPNHFHGIVMIAGDGNAYVEGAHTGAPLPPTAAGDVVGADLCVCPDECVCPDPHVRPDPGAHPITDNDAGAHTGHLFQLIHLRREFEYTWGYEQYKCLQAFTS